MSVKMTQNKISQSNNQQVDKITVFNIKKYNANNTIKRKFKSPYAGLFEYKMLNKTCIVSINLCIDCVKLVYNSIVYYFSVQLNEKVYVKLTNKIILLFHNSLMDDNSKYIMCYLNNEYVVGSSSRDVY